MDSQSSSSSTNLGKALRDGAGNVTHRRSSTLPRVFWGFFFLMAAISMVLGIAVAVRLSDAPHVANTAPQTGARPEAGAPIEQSASELDQTLSEANKVALTAVTELIDPLLDAAYAPVYEAIPIYADYHYSVWGEYAELGAAALGDVGAKLKEMLFDGLDSRLADVSEILDQRLDSWFETEVRTSSDSALASGLGPLTNRAIEDALSRMVVTVPVGSATAIGTAATIKVAASAMAKKIASKLAIKAAAKSGGKWVAALGGAGTGIGVCSWTGPGAAFCAAAGGVGAWLVADYGIVKLDEYWNRKEFESDLREMVDEQKAAHKTALLQALKVRAEAVEVVSKEIVQDHDFTLRELAGEGSAAVCKIAGELSARYNAIRFHVRARTPEGLAGLKNSINERRDDPALGPFLREMEANLDVASLMTVGEIAIKGNLPDVFRDDADVSGLLYVNNEAIPFARRPAFESRGFTINVVSGGQIRIEQPMKITVVIEQHFIVWPNRAFAGSAAINVYKAIGASAGLDHRIKQQVPIDNYTSTSGAREFVRNGTSSGTSLDVSVRLIAAPLPAVQKPPRCE